MSTGAGKAKFVALYAIEQQPIRFNVKISKPGPISSKRMIPIARRKGPFVDQKRQNSLEFFHILATPLGSFHVLLELPRPYRRKHVKCQGL